MNNSKYFTKSKCVDLSNFKQRKMNRRRSYDIKKKELLEETKNTLKNKLKKIEKNKFRNIPKNENINKRCNKDKNYNYYVNILKNIVDNHFDNTNIRKKTDNNLKISSLIPKSKKRYNKPKQKTIKESESFFLNNKRSKKRYSCNIEDKISKHSKNSNSKHTKSTKKKSSKKKYNSSHEIINVKKLNKLSNNNITKFNELENAKHILKDEEKSKIKPKKEKKEEIKKQEKEVEKKEEKEEIKNKENERDNKEKNVNIILKENNINTLKINKNKRGSNDKRKETTYINNVKTKSEYETLKTISIKEKKEKNKKYRRFPFCCLTINDNNSSDND